MADQPEDKQMVLDFRDIGATGLRRFSGFVLEEFLPELTGWRGAAVFKEMSNNDSTVAALLFAIRVVIRQVKWRTEPASDHPDDEEGADFLQTCMDDMSQTWVDTIDEILTMLIYGYSVHEIVYKKRGGNVSDPSQKSKYDDGRIGWRKLPIRSQDTIYRWQFDDHGGIQGVEQLAPPHYYHTAIPIEKILLFRTTIEKNNPEGKSILRGAWRSWYMKKNIENIEAIGIERDLAGLPSIGCPPELFSANASQGEKAQLQLLKQIATNIRRDEQEGLVFPRAFDAAGNEMYKLELLSTGGQRQFDTDKIISRYDQRIAMTALADFLLMGHDATGGKHLVGSRISLFAVGVGTILDMIQDVINRFAVPRLFAFNDIPISDHPQIRHGDVEMVDLEALSNYIQKLALAGMPMFPNFELEKYLMAAAKLPEPKDEMAEPELQVQTQSQSPKKITEIPVSVSSLAPTQQAAQAASISDGSAQGSNPAPKALTNDNLGNTLTNQSGTLEMNSSRKPNEENERT